ncbi:MAG: hypothetical protein HGA45_14910 [Chloroflexales bacterium]|nr:hypothetical protein [Chloroflexales bacterium]
MQIEDGGDSPEVNGLLLDALRAGVHHQVGAFGALPVLRAIDVFAQAEEGRWAQLRAGTLPPIQLSPEEQLDELIPQGYQLVQAQQTIAACDIWLAAWDLVKQLARPDLRSPAELNEAYRLTYSVDDWSVDLVWELGNAGIANPAYSEHQVQVGREALELFSDQIPDTVVNMMRAQGVALWRLGRRSEAEATYAALVKRLPDEGWAYIGWSDQYWLYQKTALDYEAADAILRRALARPALRDREFVLERLASLYTEWGKPPDVTVAGAQHMKPQPPGAARGQSAAGKSAQPPPPAPKLGRNDPCWCGSGRKYKQCHLPTDTAR